MCWLIFCDVHTTDCHINNEKEILDSSLTSYSSEIISITLE